MKKSEILKSDNVPVSEQNKEGYKNLLNELKSILSKGQGRAYKAVDNIKVQTYWQIGERIVREELSNKDRADYGKDLVNKLSVDLGIQRQRLYEIVKFFRCYAIVRTVSGQLSWNHYLELIKIKNKPERNFYQKRTINESWSVRQLRIQIKNDLYDNTASKKNLPETIERRLVKNSSEIFKAQYDLGFIGNYSNEKELESKIVKNIDSFLNEMGHEISYCGRQIPVKIDGLNHYIDLCFYHKGIPCNILVELKTRKLDARDVGQMNKYVNYFRNNRQYEHEKDTIGLIICSEKGMEEAQYALGGLEEKIFVATYKSNLPTIEQLKEAVKNVGK